MGNELATPTIILPTDDKYYADSKTEINEDWFTSLDKKLGFKWNENPLTNGTYSPDGSVLFSSFRLDNPINGFDFSSIAIDGDEMYLSCFYINNVPQTLIEVVNKQGVVKHVAYIQNLYPDQVKKIVLTPQLTVKDGFLENKIGFNRISTYGEDLDAIFYTKTLLPNFTNPAISVAAGKPYFALNDGKNTLLNIKDPLHFQMNLESYNKDDNAFSLRQVYSNGKPSLILQINDSQGNNIQNYLLQSDNNAGVNINDLWQNQFVFNNGSFVPFSDTFKTKPFAQKLTDLESFYVPGNFYEHAGASKFTHWISDYTSLNSENNVYKMPSNWANEGTEEDVIEKATELYGFKENSVIDFGDKEADFSKMSIAVFKQPSTITLIQIKNADGTLVKNLKINDFDGTKLTSENFKGVSVNSSFNSIKPGIAVGPQNNFEQSVVVGVFASLAVLAAAIAVIYGCYNGYKKLNQTFSSSNQEEPGGSQGLDIKNIDNKVKNNSNGQAGNIQQGSPQQKKKRGEISLGGNSKF